MKNGTLPSYDLLAAMEYRAEEYRAEDNAFAVDDLVKEIVDASIEAKGSDIVVLNMEGFSDITDRFIVVSGRSDRQVQGISNRIYDALLEAGLKPVAIEGLDRGQWVVLDYGSVIVHVFYESTRELYDLEGFWSKAKRGVVSQTPEGGWVTKGEAKLNSAA